MSAYTDKDFRPKREFWQAMTETATCPFCNYCLNGSVYVWRLLEAPQDFECNKCGNKWSVAIPLGRNPMRDRIERLLEAENEFYILRDKLRKTIEMLHGRT